MTMFLGIFSLITVLVISGLMFYAIFEINKRAKRVSEDI